MGKKRKDSDRERESAFGDLEESFFASGEGDDFWDDEKVEAFEDLAPITAEEPRAAAGAPPGLEDLPPAPEPEASVPPAPPGLEEPPSASEPEEPPPLAPEPSPVLDADAATEELPRGGSPTIIAPVDDEAPFGREDSGAEAPGVDSMGFEEPVYSTEELRLARLEREARRTGRGSPSARAVPEEAAEAWREAARGLEREAERRTGPARARLLVEAGTLWFSRLGDWTEAERLFRLAREAGADDPEFLKHYADVAAGRDRRAEVRVLLEERARQLEGRAAAEALEDAALAAPGAGDEEAVELLRRALERDPDDWFALRLLRELHRRARRWAELAETLDRMARIASGAARAELLVERARVLEDRLGRSEDAIAAYRAALEARPGHAGAMLALERIHRRLGQVEDLVALFRAEAERVGGDDAAFWLGRAVRAARRAGLPAERVRELVAEAVAAAGGSPELLREQQAFARANGLDELLAAALRAEAEALSEDERAWALYRLGVVLERRLGRPGEAMDAYREALALDPSAVAALHALERLLAAEGRHRELLELLRAHVEQVEEPNRAVTALYRMGELCEGPLDDQEGARTFYERILDTAPGYLPALEALERVLTRLEDWERLAAIFEQRAVLSEQPAAVALHLHRAGSVLEHRLGDLERARDFYHRALEAVPDFPPSLDAYLRILEREGDWEGLARTLLRASEAAREATEVVSLAYRAARVLADKTDDVARAMAALQRCLDLSPGFLPAIALRRALAARLGDWEAVYELDRVEADAAEDLDRRDWCLLAAAETARELPDGDPAAVAREILAADEACRGAAALLEVELLAGDDTSAALELLQRRAARAEDEAERVRVLGRLAVLAAEAGDSVALTQAASELATAGAGPLLGVARAAEAQGFWEEAIRALEAAGAPASDAARVVETWAEDPDAALEAWRRALEADPADVLAAAGLERAAARSGAADDLLAAHSALADHAEDPAVRAVHALLAGHLHESRGDAERAEHYYRVALAARPGPGKALDGLLRVLEERGDADAIEALAAEVGLPARARAEAFEAVGAHDRAAAAWREALEAAAEPEERLALLARLEPCLARAGDWRALFEALTERLDLVADPEERAAIEGRRRWVLAEKLADTEEAWEFYRRLYEESPTDREVLEALARIAGARGETKLAVGYLEGLLPLARDARERARYHRRIAEVHLRTGDAEAARRALLSALEAWPEDLEALDELGRIAEERADWRGLVGVLARRAAVTEGPEQLACYRRIAEVWEERLGEPDVARDAWRKVLDLAPGDPVALDHLVALCRATGDWEGFVDHARARLESLEGRARSDLEAELGAVLAERLGREEEALAHLDAASRAEPPSLAAAELLERLHAMRGAWDLVVEAMLRQAAAEEADEARVQRLRRAARTRVEDLHDREGAAEIYRKLLEVAPEDPEALRFLGDHLYRRGEYEEAVAIFERLEPAGQDPDLEDFDARIEAALFHFRFAEALRALDRRDEALARYEAALELNPNHLPSLEAVGPLYTERGRWNDAARVYRHVLQLTGGQGDPVRLTRTYTRLGEVELELGDLDRAKRRFNKALELRPNDVPALRGVARVLFARGEWSNLLNVYNNIIYHAREPAEVVDAYLTKGFVLDARMNLPDKAAQHYEKSLAFNPAQPVALLRLGEIHLRRGEWARAAELAERGLELEVEDDEVRAGLHLLRAAALAGAGDAAGAPADLARARELSADLAGRLGDEEPGAEAMAAALRARLSERL